jgi:hypothetical protein
MNIIDLLSILNDALKTMPDALPMGVVVDGNVHEIKSVSCYNGSLCIHLDKEHVDVVNGLDKDYDVAVKMAEYCDDCQYVDTNCEGYCKKAEEIRESLVRGY